MEHGDFKDRLQLNCTDLLGVMNGIQIVGYVTSLRQDHAVTLMLIN